LLFDVLSVIGFPLKILEIMSAASNVPSGTSIKTGYKLTLKAAIKQLVSD
jgi:hypothetical protein